MRFKDYASVHKNTAGILDQEGMLNWPIDEKLVCLSDVDAAINDAVDLGDNHAMRMLCKKLALANWFWKLGEGAVAMIDRIPVKCYDVFATYMGNPGRRPTASARMVNNAISEGSTFPGMDKMKEFMDKRVATKINNGWLMSGPEARYLALSPSSIAEMMDFSASSAKHLFGPRPLAFLKEDDEKADVLEAAMLAKRFPWGSSGWVEALVTAFSGVGQERFVAVVEKHAKSLSRQASSSLAAAAMLLPEALAMRVKKATVGATPKRSRRLEMRDRLMGKI